MKILIVSDTHGHNRNLERALLIESPIDLLIHLGDMECPEEDIRSIAGCPCEMIAGNNDFFSSLDREAEIKIGSYNVLMAHGHDYYVSLGTENIRAEGISRNKDIVMFGHTHRPLLVREKEIVMLNPGSLSYPRQEGKIPTYAIMTIDGEGSANYGIKELK